MISSFNNIISKLGLSSIQLQLLTTFIAAVILASFMLVIGIICLYAERKVAGHIQSRPGPLHVGPHGILQSLADGIKLIYKENLLPLGADKTLYYLAPVLIFLISLLCFIVIPFDKNLIVADLNIGVFYIFAISGLTVIGLLMAGYGSNNKYSFLGAMRSAAQTISFEVPMLLAILSIVLLVGSAKMTDIIFAQQKYWFIIVQPIAFLIYLISALVETNRTPFDLPEAESELVAGYHTEYSGMKFSFFFLAEYCNVFIVSAIAVNLFFGGYLGPFLPGIVWFLIKCCLMIFFIMVFRWTYPRLRIDQMLKFCWKFLVPLGIINLLLTAIFIYVF